MGAKKGDTVKVHYQGRLKDGTVFDDSNTRNEPLVFTLGDSSLIPGFENAVMGMTPGEKKTIEVPPHEGYGPHHPELVITVDRSEFPSDVTPVIGQQLMISQDGKNSSVVTVSSIAENRITLDANHPLSGKDLVFEVHLLEITPGCSCCG